MSFRAAPITLAEANRFVGVFHRHSGSLPSAKFAIAAINETGEVHGIAIAGRPKARMLDDNGTLEVNRICTDGMRNACSFLYGCCIRAAKALGYARLVTYTQASEDGASLKASGWVWVTDTAARSWLKDRRSGTVSGGPKSRWEIVLTDPVPLLVWPDNVVSVEHPSLFEFLGTAELVTV